MATETPNQFETTLQTVTTTQELAAQDVLVEYVFDNETTASASETIERTSRKWQFKIADGEPVVPGSVILDSNGEYWYDDGNGNIVRDYSTATGVGTTIGTVDYLTGTVIIDDYAGRPINASVTPISVMVGDDFNVILSTTFRTKQSPLRPSGFTMRAEDGEGGSYNMADDGTGTLNGSGLTSGEVDLDDGLVLANFSVPMEASTLFYNAVSFKSVPLSGDILGLDPVRLPADGRVPIFRDAEIIVLTHTQKDLISSPTAGQVIDAGRDKLHAGWIEDDNGIRLATAEYTLDKDAGTATLADPFNAVAENGDPLTGDLHFVHRIDDMALCSEARIDGQLTLAQPIYHDFPANDTWVASAIYLGDLQARVKNWRSYTTDVGFDADGSATNAQYNLIAYPIAIDNKGSVPERWKIKFTSSSAFEVYGEERGLVGTGSTAIDLSPVNPQTGTPYFTIKSDGWGSGWQVGNTAFFDTEAAAAPIWLIRTVLPGQATVDDDQLKIELRGDHN